MDNNGYIASSNGFAVLRNRYLARSGSFDDSRALPWLSWRQVLTHYFQHIWHVSGLLSPVLSLTSPHLTTSIITWPLLSLCIQSFVLKYLLNRSFLTNSHGSPCAFGFARDQWIMNKNKYLISNQSVGCGLMYHSLELILVGQSKLACSLLTKVDPNLFPQISKWGFSWWPPSFVFKLHCHGNRYIWRIILTVYLCNYGRGMVHPAHYSKYVRRHNGGAPGPGVKGNTY